MRGARSLAYPAMPEGRRSAPTTRAEALRRRRTRASKHWETLKESLVPKPAFTEPERPAGINDREWAKYVKKKKERYGMMSWPPGKVLSTRDQNRGGFKVLDYAEAIAKKNRTAEGHNDLNYLTTHAGTSDQEKWKLSVKQINTNPMELKKFKNVRLSDMELPQLRSGSEDPNHKHVLDEGTYLIMRNPTWSNKSKKKYIEMLGHLLSTEITDQDRDYTKYVTYKKPRGERTQFLMKNYHLLEAMPEGQPTTPMIAKLLNYKVPADYEYPKYVAQVDNVPDMDDEDRSDAIVDDEDFYEINE